MSYLDIDEEDIYEVLVGACAYQDLTLHALRLQ